MDISVIVSENSYSRCFRSDNLTSADDRHRRLGGPVDESATTVNASRPSCWNDLLRDPKIHAELAELATGHSDVAALSDGRDRQASRERGAERPYSQIERTVE